jgi:hypothetical protein
MAWAGGGETGAGVTTYLGPGVGCGPGAFDTIVGGTGATELAKSVALVPIDSIGAVAFFSVTRAGWGAGMTGANDVATYESTAPSALPHLGHTTTPSATTLPQPPHCTAAEYHGSGTRSAISMRLPPGSRT